METLREDMHLAGLVDGPLLRVRTSYDRFCAAEDELDALESYAELVTAFVFLFPFMSKAARDAIEARGAGQRRYRIWSATDEDSADNALLQLFHGFEEMRAAALPHRWVEGFTVKLLQQEAPGYIGAELDEVLSWCAAANRMPEDYRPVPRAPRYSSETFSL